jgi:hypothetical protein
MRDTSLVRRLWRDAAFSGSVWLVTCLFAPVTTVCLSWHPERQWEYLAASALYSPSILLCLFLFSLTIGFLLTAFFCTVWTRRNNLRLGEPKPELKTPGAG